MSLNRYLCVFCIAFFSLYNTCYSQNVGINTTNPRTKLEVAGDMRIANDISITTNDNLGNNDTSTFISSELDGTLKTFDVSNPTGVALGYFQEYKLRNPDGDWILDYDTRISATDYDLTIVSANFNKELIVTYDSTSANFSVPYSAAFVSGGTWHIIADYPSVHPRYTTPVAEWSVKTLIFSKDLSKNFGTTVFNMAGAETGAATTPTLD